MDKKQFESLMESWARWVHRGQVTQGYKSVVGLMIENKGQMNFGASRKTTTPCNDIEADIEACLMEMARTAPKAVHVVRIHYGALRVAGLSVGASVMQKAEFIGISIKTYKKYLYKAISRIKERIAK